MGKGLSREKEIALSDLIRAGKADGVTEEGRRSGIASRNELVESNLAVAYKVSREFLFSGLPIADLQQMAVMGLIRAAEDFDPRRFGARFSTLAYRSVRNWMYTAVLSEARFFRFSQRDYQLGKRALGLSPDGRGIPLASEIAAGLGVTLHTAWGVVGVLRAWDVKFGHSAVHAARHGHAADLDARERIARVMAEVERLKPRLKAVVERRFGLIDGRDETLEEVGRDMGVTRERIRQMEAEALRAIRVGLANPEPKARRCDAG